MKKHSEAYECKTRTRYTPRRAVASRRQCLHDVLARERVLSFLDSLGKKSLEWLGNSWKLVSGLMILGRATVAQSGSQNHWVYEGCVI